jgi:hypothetical protein
VCLCALCAMCACIFLVQNELSKLVIDFFPKLSNDSISKVNTPYSSPVSYVIFGYKNDSYFVTL